MPFDHPLRQMKETYMRQITHLTMKNGRKISKKEERLTGVSSVTCPYTQMILSFFFQCIEVASGDFYR